MTYGSLLKPETVKLRRDIVFNELLGWLESVGFRLDDDVSFLTMAPKYQLHAEPHHMQPRLLLRELGDELLKLRLAMATEGKSLEILMAKSHSVYHRHWMQESCFDAKESESQSLREGIQIRHCLGFGLWDPTTAKVYVMCSVDLLAQNSR